jgi:hypothetical protein
MLTRGRETVAYQRTEPNITTSSLPTSSARYTGTSIIHPRQFTPKEYSNTGNYYYSAGTSATQHMHSYNHCTVETSESTEYDGAAVALFPSRDDTKVTCYEIHKRQVLLKHFQ